MYGFKSIDKNYKVSVFKTPIYTGKRRTPHGLSACLLKYIYLSTIKNKTKKIQPTLRAKLVR